VASGLEPVARFEDGQGALFSHERFLYLAGLPDDRWLEDLIKMVASKQNLPRPSKCFASCAPPQETSIVI
jgi:hypothetical protein